jgi:HPt (histidine-containing phosphotransfer) domain-containing protein
MKFSELAEKLGLTNDEFLELVELFLETSATDLSRLQAAIDEGDPQKAAEVAHSIKGACGNMGFMEAYEAAREIEEGARNQSLENISKSVQVLRERLDVITELARS